MREQSLTAPKNQPQKVSSSSVFRGGRKVGATAQTRRGVRWRRRRQVRKASYEYISIIESVRELLCLYVSHNKKKKGTCFCITTYCQKDVKLWNRNAVYLVGKTKLPKKRAVVFWRWSGGRKGEFSYIVVMCVYCCSCLVCVLLFYVYLLYYVYIFFFTLDAGLPARSQYSEGPATGHLDTGFSWFPCVYKQILRWFPRFQVATTCFSCSPPDLNSVVTNFMFCIHVK